MGQGMIAVPTFGADERRAGFIAAALAYFTWGFLPVYLRLVGFADPREVLGMRILWSAPSSLVAVAFMGGLAQLASSLRPRLIGALGVSSLLIFVNWGIYVWAIANQRVMEAALAYFLAPLVNVAFGVALFGEKLSRAQIAALAAAAIGVVLQGVSMGAVPLLSIALCASWCCYGLVRKQAHVPAATGLFVETLWLIIPSIGLLIWTAQDHGLRFTASAHDGLLLALSGPVTAIPLILFAFGARRLPFTTLGLLQYLAPSVQFALSLYWGEAFTPLRAAAFAFIWLGLMVYSWDALRKERPR